jgi:hypothetical protein
MASRLASLAVLALVGSLACGGGPHDSNCGRSLLYGGEVSTQAAVTYFKDTWVWDGQTWTKV